MLDTLATLNQISKVPSAKCLPQMKDVEKGSWSLVTIQRDILPLLSLLALGSNPYIAVLIDYIPDPVSSP
jgi:hypothetical protein